jgi:hypothetical protein
LTTGSSSYLITVRAHRETTDIGGDFRRRLIRDAHLRDVIPEDILRNLERKVVKFRKQKTNLVSAIVNYTPIFYCHKAV